MMFDAGLQAAATQMNKTMLPYTEIVQLHCEEAAAVLVTDLKGFFGAVCTGSSKKPENLVACTLSFDHGGTLLKFSAGFQWQAEGETMPSVSSRGAYRR